MAVCLSCLELLPVLGPGCSHCAYPLADPHFLICGQCIKKPPSIDRALIHYTFAEPLRSLLHQFKYHEGLYLASFLSHLIIRSLHKQSQMPQCLIPVPMHKQRLRMRGFNQAAVLARALAKKLQLPYDRFSCQKIINTQPQASMGEQQRKKNLHAAFRTKSLPYQHALQAKEGRRPRPVVPGSLRGGCFSVGKI